MKNILGEDSTSLAIERRVLTIVVLFPTGGLVRMGQNTIDRALRSENR
jgi:hypothetical protein